MAYYQTRFQRRKSDREIKVINELRRRLDAGDGYTRITMKDDGQGIKLMVCADGKIQLRFYRDGKLKIKCFSGLDEVALFLLEGRWKL